MLLIHVMKKLVNMLDQHIREKMNVSDPKAIPELLIAEHYKFISDGKDSEPVTSALISHLNPGTTPNVTQDLGSLRLTDETKDDYSAPESQTDMADVNATEEESAKRLRTIDPQSIKPEDFALHQIVAGAQDIHLAALKDQSNLLKTSVYWKLKLITGKTWGELMQSTSEDFKGHLQNHFRTISVDYNKLVILCRFKYFINLAIEKAQTQFAKRKVYLSQHPQHQFDSSVDEWLVNLVAEIYKEALDLCGKARTMATTSWGLGITRTPQAQQTEAVLDIFKEMLFHTYHFCQQANANRPDSSESPMTFRHPHSYVDMLPFDTQDQWSPVKRLQYQSIEYIFNSQYDIEMNKAKGKYKLNYITDWVNRSAYKNPDLATLKQEHLLELISDEYLTTRGFTPQDAFFWKKWLHFDHLYFTSIPQASGEKTEGVWGKTTDFISSACKTASSVVYGSHDSNLHRVMFERHKTKYRALPNDEKYRDVRVGHDRCSLNKT